MNETDLIKLVLGVNKIPGALEQIRELVKRNPRKLNAYYGSRETALAIACRNCNTKCSIKCVKLLIELGAKVNSESVTRTSALMEACTYCTTISSIGCVKLLIAADANVSFMNNLDASVLMATVYNCGISSSMECVQLLIDSGAVTCGVLTSAIQNYIRTSSLDCISLLIKYCDINWRWGRNNRTPLMYAVLQAEDNAIECVDFLIKAGANVNLQDRNGNTALMLMYNRMHPKKYGGRINLLISSCADVNVTNMYGQSALRLACRNYGPCSSIECLHTLIRAGAEPDPFTKKAALEIVCKHCTDELSDMSIECVEYLVNYNNTNQQTALMALCQYCYFSELNMCVLIDLIKLTDDVISKDCFDKSALDHYKSNKTHYNDTYIMNLLSGASPPTKSARKI